MVKRLRPIKRFVLLLDDQPEYKEGGIIIQQTYGSRHMDYTIVSIGTNEVVDFGVGDRAILRDPNCGRRVMVDGAVHRLVKVEDIIAIGE